MWIDVILFSHFLGVEYSCSFHLPQDLAVVNEVAVDVYPQIFVWNAFMFRGYIPKIGMSDGLDLILLDILQSFDLLPEIIGRNDLMRYLTFCSNWIGGIKITNVFKTQCSKFLGQGWHCKASHCTDKISGIILVLFVFYKNLVIWATFARIFSVFWVKEIFKSWPKCFIVNNFIFWLSYNTVLFPIWVKMTDQSS